MNQKNLKKSPPDHDCKADEVDLMASLSKNCKGKKFGHIFPCVGGECQKCGISQYELSGFKLKGLKKL